MNVEHRMKQSRLQYSIIIRITQDLNIPIPLINKDNTKVQIYVYINIYPLINR